MADSRWPVGKGKISSLSTVRRWNRSRSSPTSLMFSILLSLPKGGRTFRSRPETNPPHMTDKPTFD